MTPISGIGSGLLIKLSSDNLDDLVDTKVVEAIDFFVLFSVFVAVALLVASGYGFITAVGDPEKIEKAQKGVTAAVVGLIIVFIARVIVGFIISEVLGLD